MEEKSFANTEPVCGTITSVIFSNAENGYAVIRLRDEDVSPDMPLEAGQSLICVGTMPLVAPGQDFMGEGHWVVDARYGMQYKVDTCSTTDPTEINAIFAYLSSGIIKGIGASTASLIVNSFGRETLEVLELYPEKLAEIRGISLAKAKQFSEQFREVSAVRRLMAFLSERKIRTLVALRLYRNYRENALEVIKTDPYIIAASHIGGTFREADTLALSMGFEKDSHQRIRAACAYELSHNLNNGHCFIPYNRLVEAAARLINVDPELVPECMAELVEEGRIERDSTFSSGPETDACYLPELHEAELFIAHRLAEMNAGKLKKIERMEEVIDRIADHSGITFAPEQRSTLEAALSNRVLIITGGPGTGKTTTVRGIIELFEQTGVKYLLAAPTGRAAKRMTELTGKEAGTIHRMLGAKKADDISMTAFTKDEEDPLDCDAVILDETSMVDILLMAALLKAIPKDARLICVGDEDQLPPVGPGRVFSAMIRSGIFPTVRLTKIFRQSQNSRIVQNAHLINRGEMPDFGKNTGDFFRLTRLENSASVDTITELCAARLPQKMGIPSEEIQVLSPSRKGELGTIQLNKALQTALNPKAEGKKEQPYGERVFREGDRVMQIRNNYDIPWWMETAPGRKIAGEGIFNGDIGYITSIDPQNEFMEINFDGRMARYDFGSLSELEHAWAVTVHKSQGSEFKAVIIALSTFSSLLLTRSILYTAVTRAKKLLILVGTDEVAQRMIHEKTVSKRYSYLRQRIQKEAGLPL